MPPLPPLPPPPPHFQGNVKATQKSKARAMPVTRNWSKLCLPCGHYFALSSWDSLSCCLQKRLKHLQIHTMGELLVSEVDEYWEKPGKSPLAIHWNPTASEERRHETQFLRFVYGKGEIPTHIQCEYSRYIFNMYIIQNLQKRKKCPGFQIFKDLEPKTSLQITNQLLWCLQGKILIRLSYY